MCYFLCQSHPKDYTYNISYNLHYWKIDDEDKDFTKTITQSYNKAEAQSIEKYKKNQMGMRTGHVIKNFKM